MTRAELIEELEELRENNASVIEMWEFIEDNSDFDPSEFSEYIV